MSKNRRYSQLSRIDAELGRAQGARAFGKYIIVFIPNLLGVFTNFHFSKLFYSSKRSCTLSENGLPTRLLPASSRLVNITPRFPRIERLLIHTTANSSKQSARKEYRTSLATMAPSPPPNATFSRNQSKSSFKMCTSKSCNPSTFSAPTEKPP